MKHAVVDLSRVTPLRAPRVTKRALAKQRTRERVLAAARSVFAERGFEDATIRDIAGAAELSTGAVFANFADKAALFDAVMAADYETAAERMRQVLSGEHAPAVEVLTAMFAAAYAFHLEQLPLVQAGLAHSWSREKAAALFNKAAVMRVLQSLEDVLQAGVDRGELTEGMDVPMLAEMLWDAYLANYRLAVFENYNLEDLIVRVRTQTVTMLCGFVRR
jgi:AcrR family transcriptional regulator